MYTNLQDELIGPNIFDGSKKKYQNELLIEHIETYYRVISNLCFKTLKVVTELKLIWLKTILDWFQMNKIQILLLSEYHQAFTPLKTFLRPEAISGIIMIPNIRFKTNMMTIA